MTILPNFDYRSVIIKGLTWHSLNRIGSKLVSIVKIFFVAKYLSPSQVGEMGLAFLMLSLVEVFSETGFNQAAVQDQSDLLTKVPAMRLVAVSRGIILCLILLVSGPIVDNYFQVRITPLLTMMAFVPLLKGLVNPNILALAKNLAYRRDSVYQFTLMFLENSAAIFLVIWLRQPIAIIYAAVLGAFFSIIISYLLVPTNWRLTHLGEIKKLFKYGRWVTGGSIMSYLSDQVDDFTVAKLLGTGPLGYYQTSYKIATLPTTQGSSLLYQVFFPLFSKIKDQKAQLKKTFIKILALSMLLSTASIIAIIILAPWFIPLLMGEKWLPILPSLYVLSVYGLIRANTSFASVIFDAIGKPNIVFVGNTIKLVTLLATLLPLTLKYSYVGTAISVSLAQLAVVPWVYWQVRRVFAYDSSTKTN
jgi:PST family polysaccharide transporter/lipopolysaccharide exporter